MTVLDKNLEYKSVIMMLPKRTIYKEEALPAGYRYVEYTEGLREDVASLLVSLNMYSSKEEASKELDLTLSNNRSFFKEHSLFVVDDQNRLIGFASLKLDDTFTKNQVCIQWFGVKEENQRNKIGTAMISKLSMNFDLMKSRYPLYIKLDSYAYVAIAMLSRMGFNPFMGEYQNHSEEDSTRDWEVVTNILKEMSNQGKL